MSEHTEHPGLELLKNWLEPFNITPYVLAKILYLDPKVLDQLTRGEKDFTEDLAAKIGDFFGTSPRYWLNLQLLHNLKKDPHGTDHHLP